MPAYRARIALGPRGCAASSRAAARVLSLPIHAELGDDEVARVAAAIAAL